MNQATTTSDAKGNGKPYRTKAGRQEAREKAVKRDGRWVSDVPVRYHTPKCGAEGCKCR